MKISRHLSLLVFLLLLAAPLRAAKPIIALISGEYEYKSAVTLPAFKNYLETNFPVRCIYLSRPADKNEQTIAGLDALVKADVAVLYIRRMTLPEDELAQIKKFIESGKPIVALRTSSHAFENWKEFDKAVLGGNYKNHLGKELKSAITIAEGAANHPILEGFRPFPSNASLYRNTPLGSDTTALLVGEAPGHPAEPVAWTRMNNGGRVFYTSLGHPDDFQEESFRTLVANGIYWAMNRPKPIAVSPGAPKRVDVEEFERMLEANHPIIIDVRTAREYDAGHLEGALNIDVNEDDFEQKVKALDPNKTYMVYCAVGGRSARACKQLSAMNFKYLFDLAPGFKGWDKAGKPSVK